MLVEVERIACVVQRTYVTTVVTGIVAVIVILVHYLIAGRGALCTVRAKLGTGGADAGLIVREIIVCVKIGTVNMYVLVYVIALVYCHKV